MLRKEIVRSPGGAAIGAGDVPTAATVAAVMQASAASRVRVNAGASTRRPLLCAAPGPNQSSWIELAGPHAAPDSIH